MPATASRNAPTGEPPAPRSAIPEASRNSPNAKKSAIQVHPTGAQFTVPATEIVALMGQLKPVMSVAEEQDAPLQTAEEVLVVWAKEMLMVRVPVDLTRE